MTAKCEVRPIDDLDVGAVASFLNHHLNTRVPVEAWEKAMRPPWSVNAPNRGFMLIADQTVVGAYLAIYSERDVNGRRERFCNLAAFCVLPEFRSHGLLMARALVRQHGYTFTDLSPSGNVVGLNERLGFRRLDTTTLLLGNYPWPVSRRVTVSSDLSLMETSLTGSERAVFRDHRDAAAARHILITAGGHHCYVIARRERRKRLPLFATLLYVSNPPLLHRHLRQFASHLLVRHGAAMTLLEPRVAGFMPTGHRIRQPRPRMFKSEHLEASDIDYLYSELVCLAW